MRKLAAIDIGTKFKLGNQGIENTTGYGSIGELISAILPNIYVISGVILFILLIASGIMFIASAGQGENPEKAAKAKQAITTSLIGFLIIFASYWIIRIIEVITGLKIFGNTL